MNNLNEIIIESNNSNPNENENKEEIINLNEINIEPKNSNSNESENKEEMNNLNVINIESNNSNPNENTNKKEINTLNAINIDSNNSNHNENENKEEMNNLNEIIIESNNSNLNEKGNKEEIINLYEINIEPKNSNSNESETKEEMNNLNEIIIEHNDSNPNEKVNKEDMNNLNVINIENNNSNPKENLNTEETNNLNIINIEHNNPTPKENEIKEEINNLNVINLESNNSNPNENTNKEEINDLNEIIIENNNSTPKETENKEEINNLNVINTENNNSTPKENENKEEIINTEEESQKIQINEVKENNQNNNNYKRDNLKITGDNEIKTNFNYNAYFLGNLFMDIVNKYDKENDINIKESRQLLRSTISKKKNVKKEEPKDKIHSFNFNEIISVKLNEVKQNTLSYLEKAKSELDKRYSSYIKKINDYVNENELKIAKVLPDFETNENFMNYADDNIFKQIDYLLEIHDNIFSALEDHINLLFTFLDQISLIKQKNPFEYFLNSNSNEILNCWFLSKINFNKLSLSNVIINKDLSDLVSGYLCKKKVNNFAKITIQKDTEGNLSLESDFLRDNINSLEKLKFLGLSSDSVSQILNNLNKKKNDKTPIDENIQIGKKLHSLSIIDTKFYHQNLPKFSLPLLRKVKIKKSLLPLGYFFDSIVGQTSFLKIINFQNCKINDRNFLDFFHYLSKRKYLQDSLQYLSFSGNTLTYINLKKFINSGGDLKNLQYFDLSKNFIYEYVSDNLKATPLLRILDLSDNNISNYNFFNAVSPLYKKNKMACAVLLSNNIFVSNNKFNNRNYRKYIYDILTNFKFKIKKVNLTLLYNKDNIEELTQLRISPSVKISLVKLNLSFCGLKTETIWKFFQNNFGLLNLVSLNLSYNFISNSFFSLCSGQDILLEKLKIIDISRNDIHCKNLDDFQKIEIFINNYQKLKKIKIQKNDFINELMELYKEKKDEINAIIDKLKLKEIKFFVETRNESKVFNKLNDIIGYKDKI